LLVWELSKETGLETGNSGGPGGGGGKESKMIGRGPRKGKQGPGVKDKLGGGGPRELLLCQRELFPWTNQKEKRRRRKEEQLSIPRKVGGEKSVCEDKRTISWGRGEKRKLSYNRC